MFTGIIEEIGTVAAMRIAATACRLTINASLVLEDIKLGDSIAVNGVCLTVDAVQNGSFFADVMPETMRMTSLGALGQGSPVNLERALAANGRFGGHMVTGHIDGMGAIRCTRREDNAIWMEVAAGQELMAGIVHKGSVSLDGVSLTVARLEADGFWVSLIPHTLGKTILFHKQVGDSVNIECDIIGKYVQKLLTGDTGKGNQRKIDMDFLAKHGFC